MSLDDQVLRVDSLEGLLSLINSFCSSVRINLMRADQSIQRITAMGPPLLGPAAGKRANLGRQGRRRLQTKSSSIAEGGA